jgi:putative ABC transport system permease protein
MFRNYIKIAFRNIARSRTFSVINSLGLAIGLSTCFLITLYILNETSFDKHHVDGNRVYRIATKAAKADEKWAACPAPVAWAIKSDLPEIEQVTRLMTFPDIGKMLLRYENGPNTRQFFETNGYYVDSTFFRIFTYKFKYGEANDALKEPNTIVISEQIASKFFGNTNPLGKPLIVRTPFGEFNYTVKGVFNNTNNKSHIPGNYFLSMRNNDMWNWVRNQNNWATNNVFFTYIKLKKGVDPMQFQKKLKPFFERRAGADLKLAGFSKSLLLQPLESIYLRSSIGNELQANGNMLYLYMLGSIAIFILVIACINFMNLSTARSEKRAREVGVRKVMGAGRRSLIFQFLGESFFICSIALVMALMLTKLSLPVFNQLTRKELHLTDSPVLMICIVVLTAFTGIVAGLYPAFYLSAFKPVAVLKGKMVNNFSAKAIRKGLVVFQFTISICLVIGAIVVWQQLDYMKTRHLGFEKSKKIILPLNYSNTEDYFSRLKNELLKYPEIKNVASGSTYPGIANINSMLFHAEGKPADNPVDLELSAIGNDYLETLNIRLLQGRSFSKEFTGDSASLILNESAVRKFGYTPAEAIGKKIRFDFQDFHGALNIVGVVRDFNFEGLQYAVKPIAFSTGFFASKYNYAIVDFRTGNYQALITKMEKLWGRLNPSSPFEFSFLDQDFQRNYEKEQLTSRVVAGFTAIAILIACLGLFGLSAFSAEQKTKEIGIRKVLGASVKDISGLLSREFIGLVLVGVSLASPIAWLVMNKWLENFAYKIDISWTVFVIAGLIAIVIAIITISFQAIKAGLANPIVSLRNE